MRADGGLEVSDFALAAQAAKLRGKVILDSEKWPSVIDITGTVAATNGERVLLPVSGASTYVRRMGLGVKYNVDDGDAITAVFDVDGLATDALAIDRSRLDLTGTLAGNSGAVGTFNGDLVLSSDGLTLTKRGDG